MNRYLLSKEVFNTLFGSLPDAETEKDHELMEVLRRFIFGDVFHTGDLSMPVRELITITALAGMQTLPQLKAHLNAALNAGAEPVQIREAMYQLAPFIGFPKTLNAVSCMNEVFANRGVSCPETGTVTDETRHVAGISKQVQLYGLDTQDDFSDISQQLAKALSEIVTDFEFGDFLTRQGLADDLRELLIFCLFAVLGFDEIEKQVICCLRAGITKETLFESVIQLLPYIGIPGAMTALRSVKNAHYDLSDRDELIGKAIDLIKNENVSCVVIKDGKVSNVEFGNGIGPIIKLYEEGRLNGAFVVDKIVGKASAMIMTLGEAAGCYGVTMSSAAGEWLKKQGTEFSYETMVDVIINRAGDGMCPMEQTVRSIDDPKEALIALKNKVAELRGRKG